MAFILRRWRPHVRRGFVPIIRHPDGGVPFKYFNQFRVDKIADWLNVNNVSFNVQNTKFVTFHYRQRIIRENDIPCLW